MNVVKSVIIDNPSPNAFDLFETITKNHASCPPYSISILPFPLAAPNFNLTGSCFGATNLAKFLGNASVQPVTITVKLFNTLLQPQVFPSDSQTLQLATANPMLWNVMTLNLDTSSISSFSQQIIPANNLRQGMAFFANIQNTVPVGIIFSSDSSTLNNQPFFYLQPAGGQGSDRQFFKSPQGYIHTGPVMAQKTVAVQLVTAFEITS